MERKLTLSKEFEDFRNELNDRGKEKLRYALLVLTTAMPISEKFVKKLTGTDFYELRISVDNEIRVILFAFDDDNINKATRIILLNGFVKKSTKDYKAQIQKAITILTKIL